MKNYTIRRKGSLSTQNVNHHGNSKRGRQRPISNSNQQLSQLLYTQSYQTIILLKEEAYISYHMAYTYKQTIMVCKGRIMVRQCAPLRILFE